jgi:NCAIR mutase (PurE)-related protein
MQKISDILKQVRDGSMTIEKAEGLLARKPIEDMEFARLDSQRVIRSGFPEVVYCSGKTNEQLLAIYKRLIEVDGEAFGTRASMEQYRYCSRELPELQYDPQSGILKAEKSGKTRVGKIVVCTGGTSDIPVAEQAAQTAEFFGTRTERLYDVGVAGLHRLLSHLEVFEGASCVIACAGMEGALASVIGGLVSCPVLAVPTSVGYGASFGGVSALLSMLNSCANGVAVVNIDNGFGAGYLATQINRLGVKNYE